MKRLSGGRYGVVCRSLLSWSLSNLAVFVTSDTMQVPPVGWVNQVFNAAPQLVEDKSFIFWLIDDQALMNHDTIRGFAEKSVEISKGLLHPFVFKYTQASKTASLLIYLLTVVSGEH